MKHGVRVGVTNLYSDEVGNPQLPKKFQALKKHRSRVRWAEAAIALLVLARDCRCLHFRFTQTDTSATQRCRKRVSPVLPFENLSEDKANAYFAEGIQDEILTRLSKIADLKVISRTSTQHYQERAGQPARDRQATGRRAHPGRKRAEERRRRARERAADQSSQ